MRAMNAAFTGFARCWRRKRRKVFRCRHKSPTMHGVPSRRCLRSRYSFFAPERSANRLERHFFRRDPRSFLPIKEQFGVALGVVLVARYAQHLCRPVYPAGGALDLAQIADGCLIEDNIAGAIGPLRAE